MPRIRTIKPDFWTDEKIVELPYEARLLFIGLWNLADDEGYFWDEPGRIKFQLFPADQLDVPYLLELLVKSEFVDRQETADGKGFFHLRNFVKHQTISHARKSPFRDFEGASAPNGTGQIPGPLQKPRESSRKTAEEWKGKGNGKELKTKNVCHDASGDDVTTASSVVEKQNSQSWPAQLGDVLETLKELNAPEAFYNVAFWERTYTAYAEDADVFYVDELRNYLLWWHDQPASRRRKAVTRSFGTWLRKAKVAAVRRKEHRRGN